ncbi:hypothetical protein E2C01_099845 [Portunus trituberculatus]|uniref:Uncharacterized protein n=1 Tax=Portunus trituberculatus TaxID=210409 RepID=A0A5B7K4U8_PORTR|nr:hypothetical protein [Portunus trituberculatus]
MALTLITPTPFPPTLLRSTNEAAAGEVCPLLEHVLVGMGRGQVNANCKQRIIAATRTDYDGPAN